MATTTPKRAEEDPGDDEGARPGAVRSRLVRRNRVEAWKRRRTRAQPTAGGGREQARRRGKPERFQRPLLGICYRLGSNSKLASQRVSSWGIQGQWPPSATGDRCSRRGQLGHGGHTRAAGRADPWRGGSAAPAPSARRGAGRGRRTPSRRYGPAAAAAWSGRPRRPRRSPLAHGSRALAQSPAWSPTAARAARLGGAVPGMRRRRRAETMLRSWRDAGTRRGGRAQRRPAGWLSRRARRAAGGLRTPGRLAARRTRWAWRRSCGSTTSPSTRSRRGPCATSAAAPCAPRTPAAASPVAACAQPRRSASGGTAPSPWRPTTRESRPRPRVRPPTCDSTETPLRGPFSLEAPGQALTPRDSHLPWEDPPCGPIFLPRLPGPCPSAVRPPPPTGGPPPRPPFSFAMPGPCPSARRTPTSPGRAGRSRAWGRRGAGWWWCWPCGLAGAPRRSEQGGGGTGSGTKRGCEEGVRAGLRPPSRAADLPKVLVIAQTVIGQLPPSCLGNGVGWVLFMISYVYILTCQGCLLGMW